jgi:hypothetical protein
MIRAGLNGPVKIGKADNPAKRLMTLQISHYEDLHFMRLFAGGVSEEFGLHRRFHQQHIRGEWFHFVPAMMGDLGLLEITLGSIKKALADPWDQAPSGYDKKIWRAAVRHWRRDLYSDPATTPLEIYREAMAREGDAPRMEAGAHQETTIEGRSP